jgi:peptidoglycan hydrolase-like protein with peptidoglycan-binding domain
MTARLSQQPAVPDSARQTPPKRRRWPIYTVAAVLVAAGGTAFLLTDRAAPPQPEPAAPVETAVVEQVDLVEYLELDGTLTYADTAELSAPADGVVTEMAAEGATIGRGGTLFAVNEQPVVLLFGDLPAYRSLSEDADPGLDVLELESNLAALGYGEDLVVDDTFDSATTSAVEEWQADLGREENGTISPADYVVAPGPTRVLTHLVAAGGRVQTGAPVMATTVVAEQEAVLGTHESTMFALAAIGETLETGAIAYETVDRPVPVIIAEDPFTRELAEGDSGDDVAVLERALEALGYTADGDLDVDDDYDEATAEAVADWEGELGLDEDGIVQLGQVVGVDSGMTVARHRVEPGEEIVPGDPVLELTRSQRVVIFGISVEDQEKVAVGDPVTVELPDGSETEARVLEIGAVAAVPETDPEADPVVEVTLDMSGVEVDLVEAPVTVNVTDTLTEGAIVVPASALVALREGGYAVEVVEAGSTRLVAVEPGEFSDGMVAVSGDGIAAGMEVVVP